MSMVSPGFVSCLGMHFHSLFNRIEHCRSALSGLFGLSKYLDKFPERAVRLQRMPQRTVQLHLVAVPPALALLFDHTGCLQFRQDALHRALGDSHLRGKVADAEGGIVHEADDDVGVVGQEGPTGGGHRIDRGHETGIC